MNLKSILVGAKNGTLGCFARTGNNLFCGLSCAHVLAGSDGLFDPQGAPDIVRVWDAQAQALVECGQTLAIHRSSPPVVDCGIFQYAAPFVQQLVPQLKFLPLNTDIFHAPENLIDQELRAFSGPRNLWLHGTVVQVFQPNWDFIIRSTDGLGFMNGDSGMMWLDENGHAVAMHVAGDTAHQPSLFSYSTVAYRLLQQLDITLFTL